MWRNVKFLHICYVEKFEINSTCGEILDFATSLMHINLKFLHMTNFSPQISFVIFATKMRYAQSLFYFVPQEQGSIWLDMMRLRLVYSRTQHYTCCMSSSLPSCCTGCTPQVTFQGTPPASYLLCVSNCIALTEQELSSCRQMSWCGSSNSNCAANCCVSRIYAFIRPLFYSQIL